MGLFGKKKVSYLGVDLGAGGAKLVELRNEKGRARLVTYAFTERLPGTQMTSLVDDAGGTVELLKKMVRQARTSTTRAVAGLPIASVFSSVITVPKSEDKDLKEAIQRQARKLIPVPLEEMVLDYKMITPPTAKEAKAEAKKKPEKKEGKEGEAEAGKEEPDKGEEESKTVQVLITGAAKSMVQKYVNIFKSAGLELVSLETMTFALIRSLVGKDRATTMLVDIGASRTNILIVDKGIPFVTRSLDLGGAAFTKAISTSLEMDLNKAEQMKCDIKSVSTIYPGEGLPKIFEKTVAPLVTELQYSMSLFAGQNAAASKIEKIILTGGASALPALAGHLSRELSMKTYVGDPWARVVYPDGLRPVLDEIGYRFAGAVGLAMRDIE